jgi:hypothetical protein
MLLTKQLSSVQQHCKTPTTPAKGACSLDVLIINSTRIKNLTTAFLRRHTIPRSANTLRTQQVIAVRT